MNRAAIAAYSWNEDLPSETTCAESTIAELFNRVGDGCAVRLWTNSLSRLAYPRMPQRLLRKGGTAPHSCRVPRFQRMANYTDDRLADWNSRHAFPSTREAKGQQMTPKRPRDPNQLAKSWKIPRPECTLKTPSKQGGEVCLCSSRMHRIPIPA